MCNLCGYIPLCYHQLGGQNEIVLRPALQTAREGRRDETEGKRLEGKRRSWGGKRRRGRKERGRKERGQETALSVPKELVFFLPCTNSLIYCMSAEVNSPL